MQRQTIWILLGGAAVLVLAIYSFTLVHPGQSPAATSTPQEGIQVVGTGSSTVTEVDVPATPAAPNYRKSLTFSSDTSSEVRSAITAQFNATVAVLDKNPLDFDAWVNLGTLRKMTQDYTGAAEAWSYTAKLYPGSTVSFDNLGVLYMDFLQNYPKAEAEFRASIAINPHDINAYQQLFSLYTVYGYKSNTSAAADLIAQGLKDNPGNETLKELEASLQVQ